MRAPRWPIPGKLPPSTAACVVALAAAVALKLHYRSAGSDDLLWILRPTAWLLEWLLGVALEYESGAGYWAHALGILVAPACAGVNFLVIAFVSVVFPCASASRRFILQAALLAAAAAGAFLTTLWANALRIVLAARLYGADVSVGWMTPDRIHRLEGVLVYGAALWVFSAAVRSGLRRLEPADGRAAARRPPAGPAAPLAWYVVGIVAVPLLNPFGPEADGVFLEHAVTVFGGCALLAAAGWGGARALRFRGGIRRPRAAAQRAGEGQR